MGERGLTYVSFVQVLGGVADTVAQLISAFKTRRYRRSRNRSAEDILSIEIHDRDKARPSALGELGYGKDRPPTFDFERLTRYMSYGFFMAPVQFHWFKFLSKTFPLTKSNPTFPALKRVAVDQFIFAPLGMSILFSLRFRISDL